MKTETNLEKVLKQIIFKAIEELGQPELKCELEDIDLDFPAEQFGHYTTKVALYLLNHKKLSDKNGIFDPVSPYETPAALAEKLVDQIGLSNNPLIDSVTWAFPGFINIKLNHGFLIRELEDSIDLSKLKVKLGGYASEKKYLVEYAHPNTHKELHVGHMRTLITGEAIARLYEAIGAKVFRANYQGDIGPHVAKAIWGTKKILEKNNENFDNWENRSYADKAHLLGQGYALGCQEYDNNKDEIDQLNQHLYSGKTELQEVYQLTRSWSLGYYDEFYTRFYTKFDKLFFESQVAADAKKIVEANVGSVFKESEGAVVFEGEKYGLHTRVFITKLGTPTYECKEVALAIKEREAFEFDQKIHVVANEQTGYFQVVFKAIEEIFPWYQGRQYHLPMGMVNLVGKKMSSRTGEVVTVDSVLDEVKNNLIALIHNPELSTEEVADVAEKGTIAAVKFSVLKPNPVANTVFDIKKSVDLEGDSGPYLLYTYARCQSVMGRSKKQMESTSDSRNKEEQSLIFELFKTEKKVLMSAEKLAPSILAEHLLIVARKYNEFYAKHRIIDQPEEGWRIFLTKATASTLKLGLDLLGIKTVERM